MRAKVPFWRVLFDVPLRLTILSSVGLYPFLWPFTPWMWTNAFEKFMGLRRGRSSRGAKVGLAAIPVLVFPRALPLVGLAISSSIDPSLGDPLRYAIGGLAWFIASLVTYPLYAAPLEMLDRDVGLLDSVVSAAAKSARQPIQKVLLRAFIVACAGALPWFGAPFFLASPATPALMLVSGALSPALVVALVAYAWSDGRERFGDARTPHTEREPEAPLEGPMRRRLAGALVLAMAPVFVVTTMAAWAVLRPTRAWRASAAQASLVVPNAEGVFALPTPTQLTVHRTRDVVEIASADGGGVGEVRMGCNELFNITYSIDERVFRERVRGQEVWTYRFASPSCASSVSFTDEGVRVDDTTYDRITQRWGGMGSWVAFLVAMLCALAAVDQLRWLGRARNLDATSKTLLGTVALEGRIVGQGVALVRGTTLKAPAGLRIDLGEHGVLRLPPDGTLTLFHLAQAPLTLVAGDSICIITALQGQQGSPFRNEQALPPKDARVIPGKLADAREAYVQFATRRMAITGLFSLVCALVFALVGLFHL